MSKKKKSIWSIFKPVALVAVALFTSIFGAKVPALKPVFDELGNAAEQVILMSKASPAKTDSKSFIDSVQTVPTPEVQPDSVLSIS